jgi:glyoxylase-like metal-dependent hydrolase (beta-lactamase superfamily II)
MDIIRKIEYPFRGFYSIQGDILISDHFDFQGLGFDAYALHTPGHTAGSLTVVVDNEIALVGDALMGYVTGHSSPAFADNPDQLVTTWGKLLDTGCRLFLPSHGGQIQRSELEALVAKH